MLCLRQTALTARTFSIDTGCPPPELLVTVNITSGTCCRPTRAMQLLQRFNIHISLERQSRRWLAGFGNRQIDGFSADELDIGAGGVEVGVVGHNVALFAGNAEQDALRRASLVGRNDVLVPEDVLDRVPETVETLAAGVALIAFHDRGPLVG